LALKLWDHLTGWFMTETGIDNSTVLQPIADRRYAFAPGRPRPPVGGRAPVARCVTVWSERPLRRADARYRRSRPRQEVSPTASDGTSRIDGR
jgi:hypothetical protein